MGDAAVAAEAAARRAAPVSITTVMAMVACQVGLHACMMGSRMALPLELLRRGHPEWQVGVLMAMFAVCPALLALPAGRLADRHGYHRPVRLAALLALTGAALAALTPHLLAQAAAAALTGTGASMGLIAVQRTAGRLGSDPTERMRLFSWVATAPAMSILVGPMLAGVLIDHLGFRVAYGALALCPVLTLLLVRHVPREALPATAIADAARRRPAWDLLRSPELRRVLFINWVISAAWDAHGFALPVLGHERGLSASAIGAVLSAYAVASTSVRLVIPLVAHRLSPRVLMMIATGVTALTFAFYPLFHTVWAMGACAAVMGLAFGFVQPAMMAALHHAAPPGRHGEVLALRSMAINGSASTMPMVFGAVAALLGAGPVFWLMGVALGGGCWGARRVPVMR